jgi:hypothetical protein
VCGERNGGCAVIMDVRDRFEKTLRECFKHKDRMQSAWAKIRHAFPLDGGKYNGLTEDEIGYVDQYLFRFAKLQDAMGQRLFRELLIVLEEDTESMAFVDMLNRLEKLGRLESADVWRQLRKIGNQVSHEYDDDPEYMATALNAVFEARTSLFEVLQKISESNG